MSGQPFRIEPALPAAAYTTYQIVSPPRPATCAEVDCAAYLNGWETAVDESTELGQRQAHYIRHDRTRRAAETCREDGLTVFTFEAGQTCFGSHTLPAFGERFFRRGGDWRGNPRGEVREHARADDWVEDFALHQERLKTALERG